MTASISGTPNPLASLTGRVKPLDIEEFAAVAQQIAAGQESLVAQQQAIAAQQEAVRTQAASTQTAAAEPVAATTTTATAQAETAPVATTQATTRTGSGTSGGVAIPSSAVAPRREFDYWNTHIAQFAGKYLPDGPTMRPNCGPASVTMALRMVGLDIPGFSGQNSEAVLDQARILATGKNDTSVGTTDAELETLINKSGAQWSETTDFNQMTGWVKQGIPVVLSGNPAHGWNSRYSSDQVFPFDGGHWVTVSGYDAATGHYIVNDPLSQIGPIYVSEAELRSYNKAHGNLGIAVFRDAAQQQAA
ncbi:MAG: hypothetical protein JWO69_1544 [Thermoleophilia bacterium]|nr:hypothetical protein [Thermoleophilia bacterium]